MRVSKWGNSLVRLSAAIVEALRLRERGDIEIHAAAEFGIACEPSRQDILNQRRAYRGRLPPDFKFDREEASAR